MNRFLKIFIFIIILIILYYLYDKYQIYYKENYETCNLNNLDIDDVVIIKRTPEYSKYINGLVDEKDFIFTKEQINILKNPQQIFNVTDNTNNIKNISEKIYKNCKGHLDNEVNSQLTNDIISTEDNEYNSIEKQLRDDIKVLTGPNCTNTGVLRNDEPFTKNYLKNYYKDVYGNRVEANLSDYFTAYYTLINNDENVGIPVNTQIGKSDFIIPDQYEYNKNFSNAYNIDWDRMINPISYS